MTPSELERILHLQAARVTLTDASPDPAWTWPELALCAGIGLCAGFVACLVVWQWPW